MKEFITEYVEMVRNDVPVKEDSLFEIVTRILCLLQKRHNIYTMNKIDVYDYIIDYIYSINSN